jgi:two-component system response regulator GlrR
MSEETRPAEDLRRLRLKSARVEVMSGPDQGVAIDVRHDGVVVGKGAAADLRLSDSLVSRTHVQLRAEKDGVRVTDLQSRNGTRIAGVRVHEVTLLEDTVLEVGDSSLIVRVLEQPLDLELSVHTHFGEALGRSAAMRHVFALLEHAAGNAATVLFEGDSGTGKDVLATSLHQQSTRSDGPFVVVDCGALPRDLVESELFGHEQGAFSGAVAQRRGAFELAHGGTLFLDEVGELPSEVQPKLLRVLESRSFRRVGGSETVQVDVRVMAATNRRLQQSVRAGEFREDLFYRLAVIVVWVPPLAERREDVVPLAEAFLRRITRNDDETLPPELAALLRSYSFPGNARELRNVVERYATFRRADAQLLFQNRTPSATAATSPYEQLDGLSYHEAKRQMMERFQREFLSRAVEQAGGSVTEAAKALGLRKTSLYRMLHLHRILDRVDGAPE